MPQTIKQKTNRGAILGNQNALKHGRWTAVAIEDRKRCNAKIKAAWVLMGRERWLAIVAGASRSAPIRSLRPVANAMCSEHLSAIGYYLVGCQQHHGALGIGHAEHQNFAHEFADLPGWEVHHCGHLAAEQRLGRVVHGELG